MKPQKPNGIATLEAMQDLQETRRKLSQAADESRKWQGEVKRLRQKIYTIIDQWQEP